jgi:hypothetical protein
METAMEYGTKGRSASFLSFGLMLIAAAGVAQGQAPQSTWVYPGPDGRLVYKPDALGNRIPDFSNAGYGGGGVPIPTVPVKVTLNPQASGDDTSRIQAAINQVAQMPMDANGFRGTVLLSGGEYRVNGTLWMLQSGVVLRGDGRWAGGTTIRATGTAQRTVIQVGNPALNYRQREVAGTRQPIADKYVPVGTRTFTVANASGFQVGDRIVVHRPSTAEWIHDIGMDQIPPRSDGGTVNQWQPGQYDRFMDRIITHIEGNRVTLDAPVTNALQQEYGGGSIYKYTAPSRISNMGVENIRGISDYAHATDEDHAWQFIDFYNVENGWARQITGQHFGFGTVSANRGTKWITIEDATSLDPISLITGSRRYPFYLSGELALVQRVYSRNARHDFAMNSHAPGPNVFLYATAQREIYSDTGPHHRWSMAGLFDNVKVEGNAINVRNRGNAGTGHGWAGAYYVIWNSLATHMTVESPPTAINWAIGAVSKTRSGDGEWDSYGRNVDPASLYLAQLRDRVKYPHLKHREYLVGDYDLFEHDGPGSVDNVYVDPQWLAAVQAASNRPISGFDTLATDHQVPFTVTYAQPTSSLISGMLILSLKATSESGQAWIALEDATGMVPLSDLGWSLSMDESFVGMLDLRNDLSMLMDGKLNVLLSGDVAVDWAVLQFTMMPEPGAALAAMGLAVVLLRRRRGC